MDITSISSYSELVDFVEYGYNRDGEKMPQINILMVTRQASHLPFFTRLFPKEYSLAQMEQIHVRRLYLVTDKDFYSKKILMQYISAICASLPGCRSRHP